MASCSSNSWAVGLRRLSAKSRAESRAIWAASDTSWVAVVMLYLGGLGLGSLFVIVEAAAALAAEAAGGGHLAQQRATAVFRVLEAVVEHVHDGHADVDADEVGEGQRPHRVAHAELHGRVD